MSATTPPSPAVPAGWYPDPQGRGQRYWDGSAWTENIAPAALGPAPTTRPVRTPRPTTPEAIREERRKLLNFFFIVVTFDVLVITGLAGAFLVSIDAGSDTDLGLLALASLAAKLYMAIRVYRLSEAIGHRVGLRVLYAFLSILPVVYLIPLIALLTSASRRLRAA